VRMLELGRLLSWREACSYLPCLFTGEVLLLRRAHCQIGVASVVGRTSSHQIAVRSVAEGGHSQSFIPVEGFHLSSQFAVGADSVVLQLYEGRTILGRTCWF
jgi:hypothetical protein